MHRFWDIVTRPLLDALAPATLLEIGAEDGLHTRLLLPYAAATGAHLTVVDPVLNERLAAVLEQHPDHVSFIEKTSVEALETLACPEAALIDGDHNWYTVYHELTGLAQAATRDGVLFPVCLFHDIGWPYARRDLYYDPERIPAAFRHPYERAGIVPGQAALDPNAGINRRYFNAVDQGTPRNGVLTAVEDFIAGHAEALAFYRLPVLAGYGILLRPALLETHPSIQALLEDLTAEGALAHLLKRVDDDRIAQVVKLEEKRVGEVYLRGRLQQEQQALDVLRAERQQLQHDLALVRLEHSRRRIVTLRRQARDLAFVLDAGRLHAIADRALLDSSRWKTGDRLVSLVEKALRMPRRSRSPVVLAEAHAELDAVRAQRDRLAFDKRLSEFQEALSRAPGEVAVRAIQRDLDQMQQDLTRLTRQAVETFDRAHEYVQMVQRSQRWRIGALVVGHIAKAAPRPVPTTIPDSIEAIAAVFSVWKGASAVRDLALAPVGPVSIAHASTAPVPRELIDGIRITQVTPPSPRNPFFTLVPRALAERGWHYEYETECAALLDNVRSGDYDLEVVHFHHLDPLYHDRQGDVTKTLEQADSLIEFLEEIAGTGAELVYTAHNPAPHASPTLETDLKVQEAMYRLAARVIVMGEAARDELAGRVPPGHLVVLPHPSYAGHYGPPADRAEARARLELPAGAFILGSVGELKPYKGIPLLLEAYTRFRADNPGVNAHLVIAGREDTPGFAEALRAALPEEVTLHAKVIPDSELPLWLGALDVSVFAFERMWVSGSVLLSLSYGVPVIAPDVGCIHEYAPDDDRGFLYEAGNVDALAAAMQRAVASPLLPHMRYLCAVFNQKCAVEAVAERYERLYAALAGSRLHV